MEIQEIVKTSVSALEDKKAEDIKIIDISQISTIADYFIIANGNNKNQIQAMADNVEEMLAKSGCKDGKIEGYQDASWVLMDYQDVIVHLFDKESRSFFDLERLWQDGKNVELNAL